MHGKEYLLKKMHQHSHLAFFISIHFQPKAKCPKLEEIHNERDLKKTWYLQYFQNKNAAKIKTTWLQYQEALNLLQGRGLFDTKVCIAIIGCKWAGTQTFLCLQGTLTGTPQVNGGYSMFEENLIPPNQLKGRMK